MLSQATIWHIICETFGDFYRNKAFTKVSSMKDVVRQEPRINLSVATKPIIPEEGGGGALSYERGREAPRLA